MMRYTYIVLVLCILCSFSSCSQGDPGGFARMSPPPKDKIEALEYELREDFAEIEIGHDKALLEPLSMPDDIDETESLSQMRARGMKEKYIDYESETVMTKELTQPPKIDEPERFRMARSPEPVPPSEPDSEIEQDEDSEQERLEKSAEPYGLAGSAARRSVVLDALTDEEPEIIEEDVDEIRVADDVRDIMQDEEDTQDEIQEIEATKVEIQELETTKDDTKHGIKDTTDQIEKFRVRSRFPEILFYHPNLITDDQGRTGFAVQAADAITEYLVRADASTSSGEWGDSERSFIVFQPFFIDFEPPSKLHKNDAIKTSAIIFNYTQRNISASIEINHSDHITMESPATGRISIPVDKSVEFPLAFSVKKTGIASVTITVEGDNIRDSIRRNIQVYPDIPERRLNVAGTLSELKNTLHIDIPDDSIILENDFRLRIFNDPAMGALAFVREINDKPHADIGSAASMLMASAMAYSTLRDDALLSDDIRHELNRYIDQGWIRLLAFRKHDGFAMYPGGETDSRAALFILESLAKLKSVRVVDSELKAKLINIAKSVLDNDHDYSWRLYAASLIAENADFDSRSKRELQNLLNTPEIRNSKDPAVIGLSARLEIALDPNSSLDSYINKMESADQINISVGYANLIRAFVNSNQTADKSDLKRFIDALHDTAMNSANKPFDRCYAIMALIDQAGVIETHSGIESVVINGQRVLFSANPYINEFSITLKAGRNIIEISTEYPNHTYQVIGRYFSKHDLQPGEMLDYSYRADETHEDIVFAEIRIQNPAALQSARLHIPMPSGFSPIESASELKSKTGSKFVEFRANEIVIYYSDELITHPVVFEIPFISELRGEFYIAPPFIDAEDTSPEIILDTGSRIRLL